MIIRAININTNPCHCIATDSDMVFSGSLGWDLTLVGLATYNRLLLSTLESLVPSLFIMLGLLHFPFSPICQPHTRTWLVGPWVTSSVFAV